MTFIVAIDGPAAAGKGTLGRGLKDKTGFAYVDSGSLYRVVSLKMLNDNKGQFSEKAAVEAAISLTDSEIKSLLESKDLRSPENTKNVAKVAKIHEVREEVTEIQRKLIKSPPNDATGIILEGRDIGTVVAPDADVKIYLTASAEVRAKRRLKDYVGRGDKITYEEVLKMIKERDDHDMNRKESPLKPASDAVILDSSDLSIEEVIETAYQIIRNK